MDLIILAILVWRIMTYARVRGQKSLRWGALLVLNWFMFEILGLAMATYFLNIKLEPTFMQENPRYFVLLSIFGICCGFLGYFMTRRLLDRATV